MGKPHVSPSRTYVAFCNNANFDGHYFIRFVMPESVELSPAWSDTTPAVIKALDNDNETASWYFLNFLNGVACIDKCVTAEDFSCLRDQTTDWHEHHKVKQEAKDYKTTYGAGAFTKALMDYKEGSLTNEAILRQLALMP